jgi:hypothetical protein
MLSTAKLSSAWRARWSGVARWRSIQVLPAIALTVVMAGCGGDGGVTKHPQLESATIKLRYSGPRYAGTFYSGDLPYTDTAVWIESGSGQYLQTLSVTPTVVSVGSYSHVEHLPAWQTSTGLTYADLEEQTEEGPAPSFDGLTQASVLFADAVDDTTFVCEWDLGDAAGIDLEGDQFRFCAEVANIAKSDPTAHIVAESACGTLDLEARLATPAVPTAHILELSATLNERQAN